MTTTTDDNNHDDHQPGNCVASSAQGFFAPGKHTWLLPIAIRYKVPASPPRVHTGRRYRILNQAVALDTAEVLVQGAWETLEFIDITTRNSKLNWLAKAMGLT